MLKLQRTKESHVLMAYRDVTLFASASIMVFGSLCFTPILGVNKLGLGGDASIFSGSIGLFEEGMPLLGILFGACVYWLPLGVLSLVLWHMVLCYRKGHPHPTRPLYFAHGLRQWAMPEVFLLAILVAFLKIGDLADVHIQLGLFLFVLGTLLMVITFSWIQNLHPAETFQKRPRPLRSLHAPIALGLSAMILLIPANILPIMEVNMTNDFQRSNILGGVVGLIEHKLYGIAVIVFVASIIVPIAKIGGLAWLCWARYSKKPSSKLEQRIYLVIESIGRWSMLDVFLVGFLTGLIRFGDLANVKPGPAIIPFAGAVILTILAVQQFDLPHHQSNEIQNNV